MEDISKLLMKAFGLNIICIVKVTVSLCFCRSMYGDNCDPEEREETEACNMRTCPPVCLPDYKLGDVMSNCTCEIWWVDSNHINIRHLMGLVKVLTWIEGFALGICIDFLVLLYKKVLFKKKMRIDFYNSV